ncbi:MAG TPA: hypothetical protein VNV38_16185 [Stellaceae bacterium]|jgi:hypothetical protein|nr:hypothetical protein [Stellaceae bacterium]
MKRVLLTAAALAVATGLGAAGASAADIAQPAPGTVVYGAVQGNPPPGAVPPGNLPQGYQYRWVYSYNNHGYYGHWEAERIGS